eukprot:284819221_6
MQEDSIRYVAMLCVFFRSQTLLYVRRAVFSLRDFQGMSGSDINCEGQDGCYNSEPSERGVQVHNDREYGCECSGGYHWCPIVVMAHLTIRFLFTKMIFRYVFLLYGFSRGKRPPNYLVCVETFKQKLMYDSALYYHSGSKELFIAVQCFLYHLSGEYRHHRMAAYLRFPLAHEVIFNMLVSVSVEGASSFTASLGRGSTEDEPNIMQEDAMPLEATVPAQRPTQNRHSPL